MQKKECASNENLKVSKSTTPRGNILGTDPARIERILMHPIYGENVDEAMARCEQAKRILSAKTPDQARITWLMLFTTMFSSVSSMDLVWLLSRSFPPLSQSKRILLIRQRQTK